MKKTTLAALADKSRKFLKTTRALEIDKSKTDEIAALLKKKYEFPASKDFLRQPLLFYLLIDGLNFCFWNKNKNKKFGYKKHSGSIALGYLILRTLKKKPELFSPENLIHRAGGVYKEILKGSRGELKLKNERVRILQEIGNFIKRYNFEKIIKRFENKDVELFADFMLKNLPYTFNDISNTKNISIPFHKKIRLLTAELNFHAGIKFKNMEKLLVYADYKIPQVLIYYGMLKLSKQLKEKIEKEKIIRHNSEEEIAIRAGMVAASEILKNKTKLPYLDIDMRLWILGRRMPKNAIPYHKTISRFY